MVVFDLDGTVLDGDKDISAPTIEAMRTAAGRGVIFTVATGRSPAFLPHCISSLPFISYAICANGSCVQRLSNGEQQETFSLSSEAVRETVSLACRTGAALLAFTAEYSICERVGLARMHISPTRTGEAAGTQPKGCRPPLIVDDGAQLVLTADSPVLKLICVYPSKKEGERMLSAYRQLPGVEVATTTGLDLEITAAGVTKGAGISALSKRLNIPKKNIMALGDSGNDLSMREYVGTFVAMGNAAQEVKQAADYITGCVWEDGAAHALNYLLQNRNWKKETQ